MGSVEAVAGEADRREQQRGDPGVQPPLPGGGAHVQVGAIHCCALQEPKLDI